MDLPSFFRLATSSVLCAVLVACASTVETPTVVRTPPPRGYEKTINNYLAFKIRPQKNAEINVGQPEPGPCPLDGYVSSVRGWVVPVAYLTRTGEPTGKEAIYITSKQYYFWFLRDTIAGVTPRIELCPGVGATFGEVAPPSAAAGGLMPATFVSPTKPEAQRVESVEIPKVPERGRALDRAKRKHESAHRATRAATSARGSRHAVKKAGESRAKVESRLKKQAPNGAA